MKKIEFGELRITDLAKKHIQECLDNNWVSIGPKVKEFEQKWTKLFDYPYTTMVSSGTSADIAACLALYDFGAKPGDYVICPALSFIASANSIRAAGFIPYFVDIKKETLNIDERKLEGVLKNRFDPYLRIKRELNREGQLAGIMVVNLMGNPCELDVISDLAKQWDTKLIVDNCEAYGAMFKGRFSLEYADIETTSHYIAHFICSAEGGTVSSKDKKINDIIQSVRSHGRQPGSLYFDHILYGLNLKPTDLNASIGLGEIDDFWKIFNKRKANLYEFYKATEEFSDKVYFVEERPGNVNAPHGFSITLKEKYIDRFNFLTSKLDEAGIHWKRNFGVMPGHAAFGYHDQSFSAEDRFSNAAYVGHYGIHIGCHYWLTDEDIDYVCNTLRNILKEL